MIVIKYRQILPNFLQNRHDFVDKMFYNKEKVHKKTAIKRFTF